MNLTGLLRSHGSQRDEPTIQETRDFCKKKNGCDIGKDIEFMPTPVQFLPVCMILSDTLSISKYSFFHVLDTVAPNLQSASVEV